MVEKAAKSGHLRHLALWATVRMEHGHKVREGVYDDKGMKALVRMGWMGFSEGWYYPRTGKQILNMGEGDRVLHVKFRREWIGMDAVAVFFYLATSFNLRLHDGRPTVRRPRKGRRQLQPSEHNRGIACSLQGKFFGKSKQWAHRMREKVRRLGLMKFLYRDVDASEAERENEAMYDRHGPYRRVDGRWVRVITSLAKHLAEPPRFSWR